MQIVQKNKEEEKKWILELSIKLLVDYNILYLIAKIISAY